jgi:nucleoside-diphosphate-sugar epimerase
MTRRTLVIGALGQVGSELVPALRAELGDSTVLAADVRSPAGDVGAFVRLDCTDGAALERIVREHRIDTIYHLAALLSNAAEQVPQRAWKLNMDGVYTVLEVAREHACRVFVPSSIAAFGPGTPLEATPQLTCQRPNTIYGVSKVAGELLCDYYAARFGVDVRGLRFPGLISAHAPVGGGTTDYAMDMFHHAVAHGAYTCYLAPDTSLPMMYMTDAIRATLMLMDADAQRLRFRNAYNIQALSFTPAELAEAICQTLPDFRITYAVQPNLQSIANSWPRSLDDRAAREDWGWRPMYNLAQLTQTMLRLCAKGAMYAG